MTVEEASADGSRGSAGGAGEPSATSLRVFLNYRQDDTGPAALLLYERLAARFGAANVFLDVKSVGLGTRWLDEIKSHGAQGGVLLALIGPHWLASVKDRPWSADGQAAQVEDYVVMELEFALGRWPGTVIPVLVGGARMPDAVSIPRPIRAIAGWEAAQLRLMSFEEDFAQLLAKLDLLLRPGHEAARTDTGVPAGAGGGGAVAPAIERFARSGGVRAGAAAIPAADDAHLDLVMDCMVGEGTVVPLLGSAVHGSLPDAEQLAAYLASTFELEAGLGLAAVAQRVAMARGPSFLHRAITDAFRLEPEINDVHRFLARLPKRLEREGLPARYQLIVTTNYDATLERAFDAEGEAYDLAVFVAGGVDKGHFVHIPWGGEPRVIAQPSTYRDFPIDPFDELERTVIVKVYGAAGAIEGDARWGRSYVMTEDQYIDYLVTEQVATVVPLQVLNKLTSSHCLFLGYAMRDWSLRVFLKRIWQGRPLEDKSWAIERDPDTLEKDLWGSLNVELLAAAPDEYVRRLDARLTARCASGA